MAITISKSNHHHKALQAFLLFSLVLLMERVCATEFRVGGPKGWTVPSDPNVLTYNQWAEMNRFQIGDSLLFVYNPEKDAVLQVNKDGYTNCNTGSYIEIFKDGKTSVKLDHSGPHYFISGIEDNCKKNEKMAVVVMASRSSSNGTSLETPPPSDQSPFGDEPPYPNGASSMFLSFIGSFGAFVGSLFLVM